MTVPLFEGTSALGDGGNEPLPTVPGVFDERPIADDPLDLMDDPGRGYQEGQGEKIRPTGAFSPGEEEESAISREQPVRERQGEMETVSTDNPRSVPVYTPPPARPAARQGPNPLPATPPPPQPVKVEIPAAPRPRRVPETPVLPPVPEPPPVHITIVQPPAAPPVEALPPASKRFISIVPAPSSTQAGAPGEESKRISKVPVPESKKDFEPASISKKDFDPAPDSKKDFKPGATSSDPPSMGIEEGVPPVDEEEDAPEFDRDGDFGRYRTDDQVKELVIYRWEFKCWPSDVPVETGLASYYEIRYFKEGTNRKGELYSVIYAKHRAKRDLWIDEECRSRATGEFEPAMDAAADESNLVYLPDRRASRSN
jgi:hypothetical protein